MQKPIKKSVKPKMINYHEMIDFIEKKYKIKTRDYHETYSKDNPDYMDYMDFWHWIVEQTEVRNDSDIYLNIDEWLEYSDEDGDEETPSWVKEILNLIKTEFADELDDNGGLEVWVSW